MVKQMVDDLIEGGATRQAAIQSVAETLGMTPEQVERECIETEEDELREEEPPDEPLGA